jgi:hypothetical protein
MDFNLNIHTQEGNTYPVRVAPDTRVEELSLEIVDHLALPRNDAEGQPISWSLDHKETGKPLKEGLTMEECGVANGHNLFLRRKTVAGWFRGDPAFSLSRCR